MAASSTVGDPACSLSSVGLPDGTLIPDGVAVGVGVADGYYCLIW